MAKTNGYSLPLFKIYRSPLFYVGDKFKLIGEISQYFPKTVSKFIEPFTGGGSVFLNVNADTYVLNDIDTSVYQLHKFLIEQSRNPKEFFRKVETIITEYGLSRSFKEDVVPADLKAQWKKTYYAHFNKSGFQKLRRDFNQSEQRDLFHLYILLIYGFNRMLRFNSNGRYNLPVGNVDFNNNVVNALNDYFELVKTKSIRWHNLDYIDFLNSVDITKEDFIYLDPPYLITFSEYNKLWNENKEKELIDVLEKLNKVGARFAISNVTNYKGKENNIFNDWARGYNVFSIKSNYISYHDNTIKDFKEVLITNYAL
jgi:DNA adenine methylase